MKPSSAIMVPANELRGMSVRDLDNALFAEAKRSAQLHEENESLKKRAIDEFQKVQETQRSLVTETNLCSVTEESVALESAKAIPLKYSLSSLQESIDSLRSYLSEVDKAVTALSIHEAARDEAFADLQTENDSCRIQISVLEDRLGRITEEKKLIQLERKTAEEELRRQRVESLDAVVLLQQECDAINLEIKALNKELKQYKTEASAASPTKLYLDRATNALRIQEKIARSQIYESPANGRNRGSPKRSVSSTNKTKAKDGASNKVVGLSNVDAIIGEIVESKLAGLEGMILNHVQTRFQQLENEMYIHTVPFPVYKGIETKSLASSDSTKHALLDQLSQSPSKPSKLLGAQSRPQVTQAEAPTPSATVDDNIPAEPRTPSTVPGKSVVGPDPISPRQIRLAASSPSPQAPQAPKSTRKVGVGISRGGMAEAQLSPMTTAQSTPQTTPPILSPSATDQPKRLSVSNSSALKNLRVKAAASRQAEGTGSVRRSEAIGAQSSAAK
jgi:hypothetical protein